MKHTTLYLHGQHAVVRCISLYTVQGVPVKLFSSFVSPGFFLLCTLLLSCLLVACLKLYICDKTIVEMTEKRIVMNIFSVIKCKKSHPPQKSVWKELRITLHSSVVCCSVTDLKTLRITAAILWK
jgi:hypothetical protein